MGRPQTIDRAKGGVKQSQLADGTGVLITALPAPANTRDQLLGATLDELTGLLDQVGAEPGETTLHLDAGYDYRPCWTAWPTAVSVISHHGEAGTGPGRQALSR